MKLNLTTKEARNLLDAIGMSKMIQGKRYRAPEVDSQAHMEMLKDLEKIVGRIVRAIKKEITMKDTMTAKQKRELTLEILGKMRVALECLPEERINRYTNPMALLISMLAAVADLGGLTKDMVKHD